MNRYAVEVLTKRGSVRIRYVSGFGMTEGGARQHVLHSMKKSDEKILKVAPAH